MMKRIVTLAIALAACQPVPDTDSSDRSPSHETVAPVPPVPVVQAAPGPAEVEFEPGSVTLDYGTREMIIRGTLRTPTGGSAPERAWVWAYFVNPGVSPAGSWSGSPIEVRPKFAGNGTAQIVARGHFHWAANPDIPRSGFHARVSASSVSPDAAIVSSGQRDYSPAGAVRVHISDWCPCGAGSRGDTASSQRASGSVGTCGASLCCRTRNERRSPTGQMRAGLSCFKM